MTMFAPRWMQQLPTEMQDVVRAARHYALSPHDRDFHLQALAIARLAEILDQREIEELRRAAHFQTTDLPEDT